MLCSRAHTSETIRIWIIGNVCDCPPSLSYTLKWSLRCPVSVSFFFLFFSWVRSHCIVCSYVDREMLFYRRLFFRLFILFDNSYICTHKNNCDYKNVLQSNRQQNYKPQLASQFSRMSAKCVHSFARIYSILDRCRLHFHDIHDPKSVRIILLLLRNHSVQSSFFLVFVVHKHSRVFFFFNLFRPIATRLFCILRHSKRVQRVRKKNPAHTQQQKCKTARTHARRANTDRVVAASRTSDFAFIFCFFYFSSTTSFCLPFAILFFVWCFILCVFLIVTFRRCKPRTKPAFA